MNSPNVRKEDKIKGKKMKNKFIDINRKKYIKGYITSNISSKKSRELYKYSIMKINKYFSGSRSNKNLKYLSEKINKKNSKYIKIDKDIINIKIDKKNKEYYPLISYNIEEKSTERISDKSNFPLSNKNINQNINEISNEYFFDNMSNSENKNLNFYVDDNISEKRENIAKINIKKCSKKYNTISSNINENLNDSFEIISINTDNDRINFLQNSSLISINNDINATNKKGNINEIDEEHENSIGLNNINKIKIIDIKISNFKTCINNNNKNNMKYVKLNNIKKYVLV